MAFIEIKDLSYAYDDKLVLNKLSLSIERREYLCILGKNGSGKSTLARCLNGILKPSEGSIRVDNNLFDLNRYVGMVFQNPDNQFVSSVVREDLAFYPENLDKSDIDMRIKSALVDVDMEGFEDRSTHFLSGGQKQRAAVCRALINGPKLVLADEPTGALDKKTGKQIMDLLHQVVLKNGIMLLIVTHDLDIAKTCNTIFEMDGGRLQCVKYDS